jgi:hypothetical protein
MSSDDGRRCGVTPTVPARDQNRLANCTVEAHCAVSSAKHPLLGRRWLREARAPACKKEGIMRPLDSIATPSILIALSFAILTFAASASLAQGVPALRQPPIGHRQPTLGDLPPEAGRAEAVRPHCRSGRAVKQPGAGPLFSGATKRPVLATRLRRKIRSSKTGPNTQPPTRPLASA